MNEQVFEKIYNDYSRLVYWAAYRVTSNREAAEDITQTVFERVLLNDGKLDELSEPQLKAWLYRVSTNLALDTVRKASRETLDSEPIGEDIADSSAPTPEVQASENARSSRLKKAISELDEVYRQVVMLHYFSEMTVREIADVTGISDGTIKSRLVRARTLLLEKLRDEGIDNE